MISITHSRKHEIDEKSLLVTTNIDLLVDKTKTKPRDGICFRLVKPKTTLSFDTPLTVEVGKRTLCLTILEVFNSVSNITKENDKFKEKFLEEETIIWRERAFFDESKKFGRFVLKKKDSIGKTMIPSFINIITELEIIEKNIRKSSLEITNEGINFTLDQDALQGKLLQEFCKMCFSRFRKFLLKKMGSKISLNWFEKKFFISMVLSNRHWNMIDKRNFKLLWKSKGCYWRWNMEKKFNYE